MTLFRMIVNIQKVRLPGFYRCVGQLQKMAGAVIPQVPEVDIDSNGVFKYILIKVTCPNADGKLEEKNIVRGYAECPYHTDINDKVTEELQTLKSSKTIRDWRSKVLGGGRINHDAAAKDLKVYGYSQGYGKADHQITVDILKKKYSDYNVTFSDEGY